MNNSALSGTMMSATTGIAFTNPSSGKIDQQRKILEELERRKKQLNQQSSAAGTTTVAANNSNSNSCIVATTTTTASAETHLLSSNQRSAMEVANKTSFGFFIPQDSSFGNLILPVIPRINPTSPQQQ
jgi:hypothetical protein